MAIYVIGDVHGCLQTLQALWQELPFDSRVDQLWMTGDLVNRGPDSLGVVGWAQERHDELGDRFRCVLGNHDLHLLSVKAEVGRSRKKDTLEQFSCPDRNSSSRVDAALQWLAELPLLHLDQGLLLVHAGLLPGWSSEEALSRARQAEQALRSHHGPLLLGQLAYQTVEDDLATLQRDSVLQRHLKTIRVMTRIRTCNRRLEMGAHKGPPSEAPHGFRPWFEYRDGHGSDIQKIFFGHWAALGLYLGRREVGVDSGCVWRRWLSAVRWPDLKVFQHPYIG